MKIKLDEIIFPWSAIFMRDKVIIMRSKLEIIRYHL